MKKILTCELDIALSMIGGKWKLLLIEILGTKEVVRFGEFKRIIPNINQKTLTLHLRELEENELIKREVYPEVPPRVEYSLTSKGKSLLPILDQLCQWGIDNANFDYELLIKLCK